MKRYISQILIGVNLLLAGVLVSLWVDGQGKLRGVHWVAPTAVRPDFSRQLDLPSAQTTDEVAAYIAILDRPLFSPTRRPPPPPAVVVAPPPDPLANVQVVGLFVGTTGGGIIARVDGKMRRLGLNEKIADWTLQRIEGRDVTFVRGGENRTIRLAASRPAPR
jgi:hypothetical protein